MAPPMAMKSPLLSQYLSLADSKQQREWFIAEDDILGHDGCDRHEGWERSFCEPWIVRVIFFKNSRYLFAQSTVARNLDLAS